LEVGPILAASAGFSQLLLPGDLCISPDPVDPVSTLIAFLVGTTLWISFVRGDLYGFFSFGTA